MKLIICMIISALLHGLWWLFPASSALVWHSGVVANEVSNVTKPLMISFAAQPYQQEPTPKVVAEQTPSDFNGTTHLVEKLQKQEQEQETKPAPKPKQQSTERPPPKKLNKAIVTENKKQPEASEPTPKREDVSQQESTQMASAKQLSEANSSDDSPVKLDALPLFKAPRPALSYPLRAKRRGLEGVSIFEIELNKKGEIVNLTLLRSSGHRALDIAARKNVEQWQFHPVIQNGNAVKALFTVPIKFSLS
ncbi:energy transducer TonB [Pseudoalteromonas piscicida]|uniref:energy transducer TonB n=1 Tax=Pseudoalteromonas piscicida TaxID=43662 RepID=UPI0030A89214